MSLRTLLALTTLPAILVGIILWMLADFIPDNPPPVQPDIEAER